MLSFPLPWAVWRKVSSPDDDFWVQVGRGILTNSCVQTNSFLVASSRQRKTLAGSHVLFVACMLCGGGDNEVLTTSRIPPG